MKTLLAALILCGILHQDAQASASCTINVLVSLDITPPDTAHDYDGMWRREKFNITLSAADTQSPVANTFYRINGGPVMDILTHGQPEFYTDGQSNSLEYWSVDSLGNEETPHKTLQGIKLDTSLPEVSLSVPSDKAIIPEMPVNVAGSASDAVSGVGSVDVFVGMTKYMPSVAPDGKFNVANVDVSQGDNMIQAVAYDVSGNSRAMSVIMFLSTPMVCADIDGDNKDEAIIDFGAQGIWRCDDGTWSIVVGATSDKMAKAVMDTDNEDEIVGDFGQAGTWVYSTARSWQQLVSANAERIAAGDMDGDLKDEIVADFGQQYGIWAYSVVTASWRQLVGSACKSMILADMDDNGTKELVADFGAPNGIWAMRDNGDWYLLVPTPAESMAAADLDGSGRDQVVIDFGQAYGIWAYSSASGKFTEIVQASPESMCAADIDGDGAQELAADFGTQQGIWVLNAGSWAQIAPVTAESMAKGDMDGSGIDDILVDFGPQIGVWIYYNNNVWQKIVNVSP